MAKSSDQLGIWLVGAAGNVATTVAVGLAALQRGDTNPIGLLTESPACRDLSLTPLSRIILGGHETARRQVTETAAELATRSGLFDTVLIQTLSRDLKRYQSQICPGVHQLGRQRVERIIDQLRRDLRTFADRNSLSRVVIVNLASTEPVFKLNRMHQTWTALSRAVSRSGPSSIPPSTAYAIAAILEGFPYINFTPSLGANLPAVIELATQQNVPIMGSDAKTGETLLKTVLAPMFDARRLEVLSWTGANILGNRDGLTLNNSKARQAKLRGKDGVLSRLLSPPPKSLTAIEYVESLHDWKTAWDHIHFRGFLGVKMTMQFIWQGCDSILAAPLVLDLARLADLEARRGRGGLMPHLACFFKSPMAGGTDDFFKQMSQLQDYLGSVGSERRR